ncbi:MAG TPA: hypothetical protein VFM45_12415 [Anaeromyxobacteraceae bacterium]|nr:hypothetical protein [Anaeromyxobacteraceae bacterium]
MVPELKLEDVQYRVWRGPELRVHGRASVATLRRDSTELEATDLVAIQPRADGPVVIRAPRGQGILRTRVFTAEGGVTVEHGTDVGHTPTARYVPDGGGRVTGDERLVVEGRGYRLEGTGFLLDPTTGELQVHGHPHLVAGLPEAR